MISKYLDTYPVPHWLKGEMGMSNEAKSNEKGPNANTNDIDLTKAYTLSDCVLTRLDHDRT